MKCFCHCRSWSSATTSRRAAAKGRSMSLVCATCAAQIWESPFRRLLWYGMHLFQDTANVENPLYNKSPCHVCCFRAHQLLPVEAAASKPEDVIYNLMQAPPVCKGKSSSKWPHVCESECRTFWKWFIYLGCNTLQSLYPQGSILRCHAIWPRKKVEKKQNVNMDPLTSANHIQNAMFMTCPEAQYSVAYTCATAIYKKNKQWCNFAKTEDYSI